MTKRTLLTQQMLEHVTRQRESGMTVANYAAQVGITAHKLQYWIRKFKPHNAQHIQEQEMKFINIDSLGLSFSSTDDATPSKQPTRQPQMTLTFPSGICLKIY